MQHTRRYLAPLPPRLKFLFVFCQLWYPLFAATSAMMYFAPIIALAFDMRFADVTYPEFLLHAAPVIIILTVIAFRIRHHGYFRPHDAPVLSWEKALFLTLQWPWAFWGCLMAIRDKLTGRFVDFRITPKGTSAKAVLPLKVLAVYTVLALMAILPVLVSDDLANARGFLLLSLLNALLYTLVVAVIVVRHLRDSDALSHQPAGLSLVQCGAVVLVVGGLFAGFQTRGVESVHALAFGLEPLRLVRAEYGIAGAGQGAKERVDFVWDPGWITRPEIAIP